MAGPGARQLRHGPQAVDPTQAPDGQDTFWLWSGVVPVDPARPWDAVRDEIGQGVLKDCTQYYVGLDELENRPRSAERPRTHPTGGVCALPGKLAAQTLLRDLRRGTRHGDTADDHSSSSARVP